MSFKDIVLHKVNGKVAFYSYDEELYGVCFPQSWATSHKKPSGPKLCKDCRRVGHWNGVFIGYCESCAGTYSGERGSGMVLPGIQKDGSTIALDEQGDIEMYNSRAVYYPSSSSASVITSAQFVCK